MTLARTERASLASLLATLGPDRPTLCDGWDAGDLMTHLLVRERRPDGALGIFLPPLAGWTKKVSDEYRRRPWAEQVELLRSGPPSWNPTGWGKLDELVNGLEMFIHHEDARRGGSDWEPRDLDPASAAAVDTLVSGSITRSALRPLAAGVTAIITGPGDGRQLVLKPGEPMVTVTGAAAEVLLWAFGRKAVEVQVDGDAAALAAVGAADLLV